VRALVERERPLPELETPAYQAGRLVPGAQDVEHRRRQEVLVDVEARHGQSSE
jgi:hypothetical protein